MAFFEFSFAVAQLLIETKLFSFKKIHIFNSSEISWGGQGKALHQRTNEQTTNEQTNNDELQGRS